MTIEQTDGRVWRGIALVTVCLVLFLTFLDNTVVSVTLPDVQTSLHAGVTSLQWVVNGYALFFASLMLLFGSLGDRFGRKRVMLAGVAVFCGGSVLSALASSVSMLVAGRIVMGVGAAASEPGTLSVIRQLYSDRRSRARAVGIWAAVSGLALALGPVVGGVLVGLSSWRLVFWFNLFFGVVAFVAAAVAVPETADPDAARIDVPGAVLGTVAASAATYGLITGEYNGYSSTTVLPFFVVAAVAGVAFLLVERASPNAMLDLSLFRIPVFSGSQAVAFLNYFGVFSIFFFVALYLSFVNSVSYYRIALTFVPMAVVMILASAFTGRWVARSGPRLPMTVGCVLGGAGIIVTDQLLSPTVPYWQIAPVLAVAGAGFGIAVVPVTSSTLSVVSRSRSGMAASITNTSRELGAVFGVSVLGALLNSKLVGYLNSHLHTAGVPDVFRSFVISAVTHGGVPTGPLPPGAAQAAAHAGGIIAIENRVLDEATHAFNEGLTIVLLLSGALLLLGAVLSAVLVAAGPEQVAEEDVELAMGPARTAR